MEDKITLEELVALRDTLNKIIAMEDNAEEFATQHIEGIGNVLIDYSVKTDKKNLVKEITNRIQHSTIITSRNFDRIALGTAFYGMFLKDEEGKYTKELNRYILVSSNDYPVIKSDENTEAEESIFVSKNCPLGQAVLGKRDDEVVTYELNDENGKKQTIVFYIDSIDRNRANYINSTKKEGRTK